jgi:hypothetical protein
MSEKLRELAEKARMSGVHKPELSVNTVRFEHGSQTGRIVIFLDCHPDDENDPGTRESLEGFAAYIAAVDPQTVLGLLAEIDGLERLYREYDTFERAYPQHLHWSDEGQANGRDQHQARVEARIAAAKCPTQQSNPVPAQDNVTT